MTKKLDIFEVLKQIDARNYDYYSTLTDEEKKSLSMWVLMRWTSLVSTDTEDNIIFTNYLVNRNFTELSSHPELQWKLLCLIGTGKSKKHQFAAPPKRQSNKVFDALSAYMPHAKADEIELLIDISTKDDLQSMLVDYGASDAEVADILAKVK